MDISFSCRESPASILATGAMSHLNGLIDSDKF
jgi:hypothetical protein